ncbi:hypothetical protein CVIRNUC_010428 [Coccomyxa viridis]|uniref:CENP-V/GFA domain-containing protein n=1 Tax=Coccomyxa viridis TaxID=1274662 RepID=A0AAV1ILV6_9CHLO|nr:hypothetical protein CVIRNUC_010428 [Coccomyxa viridis]
MQLEGGCLCGDIRYKVSGELAKEEKPAFCHCRICQRAAGALVVGWATFKEKDIIVTRGDCRIYHSSETGLRKFCGRCGTQVFFQNRGSPNLEITIASLDSPDAIQPEVHGWTDSQLKCLKLKDDLPKFREEQAPQS